jgi:hypothetical protein
MCNASGRCFSRRAKDHSLKLRRGYARSNVALYGSGNNGKTGAPIPEYIQKAVAAATDKIA